MTSGNCVRTSSAFVLGPNPVTVSATGSPTTVCTGPVQLIAVRTYGTQNPVYDWKLNGVSIGGSNSWIYSANQSGVYTCTITESICPGSNTSNTLGVNIGVLPPVYISPVSGSQTISDCLSSQIFLDAVNLDGTPYWGDPGITSFDWYRDGFPHSSFSTSIIATESGRYSLYIGSTCGTVSTQQPKIVLMTNTIVPPEIFHSNLSHCTLVSFSVGSYWLGYQWYFNNNPIPGATSYNYDATLTGSYKCQVFNACGSIFTDPRNVTITGGPPVITAPNGSVICGSTHKILTAPTGPSHSYQWKFNGNNILNAIQSTYFTNVVGSYTCQVTNNCGTALSNAILVTAGPAVPATPGSITGSGKPCPGTNNVSYSISAVAGATSYVWSVPSGFTIVSGQGTTNLVVNVAVNFVSGNLSVAASNTCGSSAGSVKALTSKIPTTPGAISGTSNGVCSSTKSFSIAAVSQATGYTWTVPTGATILNGQGTTNVSIAFNSSYGSDSIRVYAYNNCGAGPSKALYVKGRPAIPAAITGTSNVCAGQTGLTYSISPVAGAATYTWTKPSGSTITNGQGTTQITMTMGAVTGPLKVKAVNSCGSSSNKTLTLNVVCREADIAEKVDLSISPNPFNHAVTIRLSNSSNENAQGRIWNALGQVVETFTLLGSSEVEVGYHLQQGIYIVDVDVDGQSLRKKIIKEK